MLVTQVTFAALTFGLIVLLVLLRQLVSDALRAITAGGIDWPSFEAPLIWLLTAVSAALFLIGALLP